MNSIGQVMIIIGIGFVVFPYFRSHLEKEIRNEFKNNFKAGSKVIDVRKASSIEVVNMGHRVEIRWVNDLETKEEREKKLKKLYKDTPKGVLAPEIPEHMWLPWEHYSETITVWSDKGKRDE